MSLGVLVKVAMMLNETDAGEKNFNIARRLFAAQRSAIDARCI
jgi:hypothetical protein